MSARPLVLMSLACLQAACWVTLEQGQAFETDLVRLKAVVETQRREREEETVRAQRERDQLRLEQDAALRRVDAKMREITEAQDALNRTARKTGADLAVDLEKTQDEMSRLRGQYEEQHARQQQALQSMQDELAKARTEVTSLQTRLANMEDDRRSGRDGSDSDRRGKADRALAKDDFYKAAKDKLDNGDPAGARQLFVEFLQRWKDDPLAANSQYWMGETFYVEKKWREAVYEFKKVTETYPKSEKAPDALLKIGFAFAELGLNDDARLFLDEVQRSYAKSHAARLAREKIAELRKSK